MHYKAMSYALLLAPLENLKTSVFPLSALFFSSTVTTFPFPLPLHQLLGRWESRGATTLAPLSVSQQDSVYALTPRTQQLAVSSSLLLCSSPLLVAFSLEHYN